MAALATQRNNPQPAAILERHYSVQEIAEIWGVHPNTITRVFQDETGVLKLRKRTPGKRSYTTLRIPESVLGRVDRRMRQ